MGAVQVRGIEKRPAFEQLILPFPERISYIPAPLPSVLTDECRAVEAGNDIMLPRLYSRT